MIYRLDLGIVMKVFICYLGIQGHDTETLYINQQQFLKLAQVVQDDSMLFATYVELRNAVNMEVHIIWLLCLSQLIGFQKVHISFQTLLINSIKLMIRLFLIIKKH